MKKIYILGIFLLVSRLGAQDAYHIALNNQLQSDYNLPAVTQWSLPNTETSTFIGSFSYGATVTNLMPGGFIFTQARQLLVNQGGLY